MKQRELIRGIYVDDGRNVLDILGNGIRYIKEMEEFKYNEDWDNGIMKIRRKG